MDSHKPRLSQKLVISAFANITIHICHEDDLIACSLPCAYGNTKIPEEGCPRWARVPFAEEVGAVLRMDTIGLDKGESLG